MKIKTGFVLRELLGEHIVTGEGLERVNFNKIISLNESAAWLWKQVEGKEFDAGTLTGLLLEQYEVEEEVAARDSAKLIDSWKDAGLLEE